MVTGKEIITKNMVLPNLQNVEICRWEDLCLGFHVWFLSKGRSIFFNLVIQSSRKSTDIEGLFYQNDIESMHVVEKRNQNSRKEKIDIAVSNLHALVKRGENDEIRAIYGAGGYILSP